MTKENRLLFKILLVSVLIFAFSLIFSKKDRNAAKSVESAILNPSHKSEVSLIEIGTGESGAITLKKQGDFWLLSKEGEKGQTICTIADSKIINSLIENAAKIRKMYTISDKEADQDTFGLSDTLGTSISFLKNAENLCTKVHFGYEDSLKNRIYLRSYNNTSIYECENDFHQFLYAETNYWSEGEIFPEIENPVKITLKINEGSEVSPEKTLTLDEKSPNFAQKTGTLLSLRHGNISEPKDNSHEETGKSGKSRAILTIQDGNGRIARLTFYALQDGSYFYTKNVTPSEIDSQETRFALYSENAAYEISEWTYKRIISLF